MLLASCTTPDAGSAYASPGGGRPVLVELFSSEGCSSCPPADAVLSELAMRQPVSGAEVIALELHVDYWNHLGWSDPFSRPAFSARQRAYADATGAHGVYTPQMVIDGEAELVGSRRDDAKTAVAAAAKRGKGTVLIERRRERVLVTMAGLPDAPGATDVWLAITERDLKTAVPRGENAGATLMHGPVVRSLQRIGTASGASFRGEAPLRLDPSWNAANLAVVAFAQRQKGLRIVAAGALAIR